ncbi:phage tail protein [Vibrio cholerae]|uniref:phage tail-collar fiber domain-containing protein n=1 Tax=Vibrio cholerae TaxID=666 RepID=UPI00027352D6|nr:phage tail protein [Vibrio cholerae]EJH67128.1 putative tail fiber protein [Vibrio cholerae HE-25]EJL6314268.1 phage tail protein [Vibrio cholerae]
MSQTAIPLQFEKYLQNQISVGKAPDMNEMIFAYIPNLDPSQPIDRNQGLPAVSTWVHQQDIDQVGKLGDNALVYSVVIPGSVAAFTFNAIYLRDKNVPNSCGMVVHKATETKEAGMASTKNLMQQYTGAAQVAGITVDAQTWQIDYQARLLGIEEDMRLANLDNYGHTAFIQGFDVTQQADQAKYKVAPGVVYVGGLRAELKNEVIQTISAKPTGLYIDVVRTGTVLSKWQNIVTVRASATPLTDYVDQNQQQHYVARLAGINANGSITDWRVKTDNADQEWSRFINYSIGHEVVRNSLRYIARAASGPDNGGAITPENNSGSTWDLVLPQAYSTTDTQTDWLRLALVVGDNNGAGDFLSLEVIGGSDFGVNTRFSADIMIAERAGSAQVIVTPKTLGLTNPEFYIKSPSANTYELWMKRLTDFSSPVTIIRKSRSRYSATVAGILSITNTAPTGITLVPYDTGYQFASIPIGMEVAFDTPPPTNDPRFRFVKLTYNDAYNTGLLTSQTLSGSAPELVSTAVISAAQSPINGQTIDMINTMGTFIRPGVTAGVRKSSQNKTHTHTQTIFGGNDFSIGLLPLATDDAPGGQRTTAYINDSGGDEANPYCLSRIFYKRIY